MYSWKPHTLFRPGRRATVVAAFLVPVLAACVATGGSRDNPLDGDARRQEEQIEILVRNLHFSQATVYTARGGVGRGGSESFPARARRPSRHRGTSRTFNCG